MLANKKNLSYFALFAAIIFLLPGFAFASSTFYINSSTGDDNSGDGSSESPYKTFYKGYISSSSGDTLNLTGTFTWTDDGESGDNSTSGYTIDKNLTIVGQSPSQTIIQAASSDNSADRRVFTVSSGITVSIEDLSIRYGKVTSSSVSGGCINNSGTLTIADSEIYSCRAVDYFGGGIYNLGTITINSSSIYSNTVYYGGGGLCNSGSSSAMTVTNCTIYSNTVTAAGGAFYGGGIYVSGGTVYLTNNTITGNTVTNGIGGGIQMYNSSANLYIKNNFVAGNSAWYSGTSDYHSYSGTIHNNGYNIIGRAESYSWVSTGDWTDSNGDGTYVLNGAGTTGTLNLDSSAAVNSSPKETKTYALLSGSIAIDRGDTSDNGSVSVPDTDQRGAGRSGSTDIGAFEYDGELTVYSPTTQASSIVFSSVQYNQMTIGWTKGDGSKSVVFVKQSDTGTTTPVDSTTYTANTVFGSGTQISDSG